MLGLMTVKRHREIVAALNITIELVCGELTLLSRDNAALRATTQPRCPKTGQMMKREKL